MAKQHIIDFQSYTVKNNIIDILKVEGIEYSELQEVPTPQSSFFGTKKLVNLDKQESWTPENWLRYLISKGFWIDSYSSSKSLSAAGYMNTDFAIIHKI